MVEKNNFATILRHNYIYIDDINFTNITKFQFYITDDYRTLLYHLNTLVVMFGEHDFFQMPAHLSNYFFFFSYLGKWATRTIQTQNLSSSFPYPMLVISNLELLLKLPHLYLPHSSIWNVVFLAVFFQYNLLLVSTMHINGFLLRQACLII